MLRKGTEKFLLCTSQISFWYYRQLICQRVFQSNCTPSYLAIFGFAMLPSTAIFFGFRFCFAFCLSFFFVLFLILFFFQRISFTGSLSFLAKWIEDSSCKSEIHCKRSLQLRITFGLCSFRPFVRRKLELGKGSHRLQGLTVLRSLGTSHTARSIINGFPNAIYTITEFKSSQLVRCAN